MKKGKAVSAFDGTYCGYLNFDGVRYWDGRFIKPFRVKIYLFRLCSIKNFLNPIL